MDFHFQERDASETKKRLDEAKARLLEEKRKLKEEMRAARSKGYSSTDPILKPWMIWDLAIFLTMILLFSVSMYYPRPVEIGLTAAVVTNTTQQTTTSTIGAITGLTTLTLQNTSSGVVSATTEEEEEDADPGAPKYSLSLTDDDDNVIEEIKTDSDSLNYNIVIKNLETEMIYCDGDRIIDDDFDEEYYKNLKVHPFEKEELPNVLLGSGRVEVKYDIRCRFETGTKESKVSAEFDAIFE